MKKKREVPAIRLTIAREVLDSVFEECDRYEREETGGRVLGHFALDQDTLVIQATGVIEPGPRARRTNTSFFQDGEYQEEVFRRIEVEDPAIEHLGNWHTHHVNGYPRLSRGDMETYRRIVNHRLHNLDFFYALLVTNRNAGLTGLDRYAVRHYVLFRGRNAAHEIDPADVTVVDQPRIWPRKHRATPGPRGKDGEERRGQSGSMSLAVRARDKVVLGVLFPSFEPRLSTRTGTFFWRGPLQLIDGSAIDIKIAETKDKGALLYHPIVPSRSGRHLAELCATAFPSAGHAARALESYLNREIFGARRRGEARPWKS